MVVIRLYGIFEDAAQRTVHLKVRSFDEALHALLANFPKLSLLLRKTRSSVLVDGRHLTFEDALRPFRSERIDIMPVVGGSGPAAAIVVGAIAAYGATTATVIGILGTTWAAALGQFGIALLLGGISQLLFKPPKPALGAERPESTPSYQFNGAVNTVAQGNVVPVGFGRMRVGSQVISVNVQSTDIPVASSTPAAPRTVKIFGMQLSFGVETP